jgi:16S rRNA processing protein RimM
MDQTGFLECGRVQNTHGCHGWIKVESYCDSPEVLASLACIYRKIGGVYVPLRVVRTGRKQETVLMQLEGIDDMDGKVAGIFESCAQKYSDAAFIVEKICVFQ